MKTTKIFLMAALALAFAACSNDDNDILNPAQPAKAEGITITATLAPKTNGAATRAVSEGTNEIVASWAVDEHIAILYNKDGAQMADATINSVDASGTATIEFTVEDGTADNTACTLVYPLSAAKADKSGVKDYASLLVTQDGVLDGDLDVRVGAGTIQTTTPSLTVTTQPAAQYSIFKFTAQDIAGTAITPSEFKISNASGNVITTVTPSASAFYVALPVLSADTYWFNATADSKPYIAKATVASATSAGKYYQSTVKMATLGDLMAANGKFYADATAITAASTTAVGVIAHIGSDATTETIADGGGHGLVLCLKNAASCVVWSAESVSKFPGQEVTNGKGLKRTENVSGYTNTAALTADAATAEKYPAAKAAKEYTTLAAPSGTTGWFLPSAQQWVKMQTGLGALNESSITWGSWYDTSRTGVDKWETALKKAGSGNYDSITPYLWYWSSSEESASNAVILSVNGTAAWGNWGFHWSDCPKSLGGSSDSASRVRPVLAF